MKDDPSLFKVVDSANINVADQFHAQVTAQQYIDHFKCTPQPDPDPTECPPGQHRDANGNCVPDLPPGPVTGAGPYASTGNELQTSLGPVKTRHYASGKPDDLTRERTVGGVPYKNYQFIVYTTMNGVEHDDAVSV